MGQFRLLVDDGLPLEAREEAWALAPRLVEMTLDYQAGHALAGDGDALGIEFRALHQHVDPLMAATGARRAATRLTTLRAPRDRRRV